MAGNSAKRCKVPKAEGIWYRDIKKGRDANARRVRVYDIKYETPNGAKWKSGYEKLNEARAERNRLIRSVSDGTWQPTTKLTLAQYAERWLTQVDPQPTRTLQGDFARTRLSPATFESYRYNLRRHVLPRLGDHPLASVRTTDINDLIDALVREGKRPGTIRNNLVPLSAIYSDAIREELTSTNPVQNARAPKAQDFAGKELPQAAANAIRAALLALAQPDRLHPEEPDNFYACLFDVALSEALRLGELRALRWRAIDKTRHLLRVEEAYSRGQLKKPKSDAGERSVPLFPTAARALDLLAARALERGTYAPDELIFQTSKGTPLHPENFRNRVWRPALKRAQLGHVADDGKWKPRFRFHDLRHTCVSRLIAAGADVKLVQAVAGHSSGKVTLDRYSHLFDQRVTDAASLYDPAAPVTTEATE
jgi:integrase